MSWLSKFIDAVGGGGGNRYSPAPLGPRIGVRYPGGTGGTIPGLGGSASPSGGGIDWGKWAGLGLWGAGTGLSIWEQLQAQRGAKGLQNQAFGLMERGPTSGEDALSAFITRMSAPNASQDGFLQYLRSQGLGGAERSLNELSTTGSPFDTSEQFRSLGVLDEQAASDAAAKLRAGAGSLGARFGTGFAQQEALLRSRLGAEAAARRAGIASSAYESAQGRRAGAVGLLSNIFSGEQANRLGLNSQVLQAIMGLGGLQRQRAGYNASLFGAGAGIPTAGGVGNIIGQGGLDLATLMYLFGGGRRNA